MQQLHRLSNLLLDRFRAERKLRCGVKTMYSEGVIAATASTSRHPPRTRSRATSWAKPPFELKGIPSLKQVESILAATPQRVRPAVAILAFTGMRSGEFQRLKPGDVDLDGGWIFIRSLDGAETKTRQSRKVPIHARLRPHLQALGTAREPGSSAFPR